ncbi:MAG: CBM9 family sugar-binding protein [Endomicrobia bacterium]|nr:CBM9 family sugar-binding protein [Endomicrobiia bacterium]
MKIFKSIFLSLLISVNILFFQSCTNKEVANSINEEKQGYYYALHSDEYIQIDGEAKETIWKKSKWYPINQCYLGTPSNDFFGRFKVAWRGDKIFLLVEISDKTLTNRMKEGFENYWQGDCVEVFIDESNFRGDHHLNNKAYSYHVMHTGEVVDIDADVQPKIFPDTIDFKVKEESKNTHIWEMAITVYSDKYGPKAKSNENAKVQLVAGKKMGFTVAYGDNNGEGRKAFYGSTQGQGDSGYMTSEKFGTLELLTK